MSRVRCPVMKPCHPNLYTFSQSFSGVSRKQAFSVQLMFFTTFTLSQSVSGDEEDQRRPSVYSHSAESMSCHQVRHHSNSTNFSIFVGRATQQGQGVSHGGFQAEGCYVSQSLTRRRKSDTCPYSQPCCPSPAVSSCCCTTSSPSRRSRGRRSLAGRIISCICHATLYIHRMLYFSCCLLCCLIIT